MNGSPSSKFQLGVLWLILIDPCGASKFGGFVKPEVLPQGCWFPGKPHLPMVWGLFFPGMSTAYHSRWWPVDMSAMKKPWLTGWFGRLVWSVSFCCLVCAGWFCLVLVGRLALPNEIVACFAILWVAMVGYGWVATVFHYRAMVYPQPSPVNGWESHLSWECIIH